MDTEKWNRGEIRSQLRLQICNRVLSKFIYTMQLILNTFGAYLSRRGSLFQIKVNDQTTEVAARRVKSILVTTGAAFSTDAIQLAIENNIDVLFLDKYGNPFGRVWHGRPGSTTAIRRRQFAMAQTEEGFALARSWVDRKFGNQINLLTRMRGRRTRLSARLTEAIKSLKLLQGQLNTLSGTLEEHRETMLGVEGRAGRTYWGAISLLLPERFRFEGRNRNPARDEFNCLLNYAYGVLYGIVERACLLAGLDPYVGFLHTDHYNKPSLVFDLIENYRIWADEVVIGLFAARKVTKALFDPLHNGLTLNKDGKAVLLERLNAHLETPIRYRGRNIGRRDIIQLDLHRIANELIEKGQTR